MRAGKYWNGKSVLPLVAILIGLLGAEAKGDFILTGNDYLLVDTYYEKGEMHDQSQADIISDGVLDGINDGIVDYLLLYNSSAVKISGGYVLYLAAHDTSSVLVNDAGGGVNYIEAYGSSAISITDGVVFHLYTYDNGVADISGRSEEHTSDSSHMSISYAVFCLKKKMKHDIRRRLMLIAD